MPFEIDADSTGTYPPRFKAVKITGKTFTHSPEPTVLVDWASRVTVPYLLFQAGCNTDLFEASRVQAVETPCLSSWVELQILRPPASR